MAHLCIGRSRRAKAALIALAAASAPLILSPAKASNIFDGHDTCTAINCGSLLVDGKIFAYRDANGTVTDSLPWSGMVYAREGECLRLEVVSQTVPAGSVVRINVQSPGLDRYDSEATSNCGGNCPLTKIDPALYSGWYSVVVRSGGGLPIEASFRLRIGRYNTGNPNCASPTPGD